jgi:hypothetical protein
MAEEKVNDTKDNLGEILIDGFIFIITAAFFYQSLKLEGVFQGIANGPGTFPQTMTAFVLVLISIELVKAYRNNNKLGKVSAIIADVFPRKVIILIGLVIIYALVLEKLHFTISTLLFLWIGMFAFDSKRPIHKLIISVIVLSAILLIFKTIFMVLLP